MNLNDCTEPEGGEYLGAGEYEVTVHAWARKTPTEKSLVEYTLVADNGQQTRLTLWCTEAAKWRTRNFAAACGFTQEERADWDYEDAIGRRLKVEVILKGKYHEVEKFASCAPNEGEVAGLKRTAEGITQHIPEDDIPF